VLELNHAIKMHGEVGVCLQAS